MTSQETLQKFNEIYASTYPKILKYVICHCNNISDVEDILQNIYYEVLRKIKKINNDAYVLGIAKNMVKEYYRFKYKSKAISLYKKTANQDEIIDFIEDDLDIERELQLQCNIEEVWLFLKNKPVVISKIFYLYFYLELTINEIAIELNLSESNVKNYLYRTLKQLRHQFESEGLK